MKNKIFNPDAVQVIFGEQFKRYRDAAGLEQQQIAKLIGKSPGHITQIENGNKDIQIKTMQECAIAFGVNHFELANPNHPIPTLAEMPAKIRKAAKAAEKARQQKEAAQQAQKEAGKPLYQTGMAKQLHQLVAEGFFARPRTSKDTYEKLHGKLKPGRVPEEIQKTIGTITGTLRNGRFAKLLDKLDPAPGTTAVRFVIKTPA